MENAVAPLNESPYVDAVRRVVDIERDPVASTGEHGDCTGAVPS
jgi:hypothetical protein